MATKTVREKKAQIEEVNELGGYTTVVYAAEKYNLPREQIGNYVQRGHIPAIRVGGKCLMIRTYDLEKYLELKHNDS
jgi:hypothetical protein